MAAPLRQYCIYIAALKIPFQERLKRTATTGFTFRQRGSISTYTPCAANCPSRCTATDTVG